MIRTILFDNDGVLVDTEKMYFEATRVAFAAAGVALTSEIWANGYLGRAKTSRKIAERMGISPALIPKVLERRDGLFWADVALGVQVMPHVRETLAKLSGNVRMAIVTGAPRSRFEKIHEATGLSSHFDAVIARDEPEEAKPSPQLYLRAMEQLRVQPDECLAVEDSPRGAVAAIAAGIKCCVIPTFLTDLTLCPKECVVLPCFAQLPEFCLSNA